MKKRGSGYRKKIMLIFAYIIKIKAAFINLINSYVMKKIFVSLAVLFACAATAFAQPVKGDMMIKGSIGLSVDGSIPYEELGVKYSDANNSISVAPSFEYFLSDNFSIGGTVYVNSNWGRGKAVIDQDKTVVRSGITQFSIGFNANYYIRMTDKLYLSLNGFLGYYNTVNRTMHNTNGSKDITKSSGNFAVLSVTPTLNYFINNNWMLTASVGNVAAAIGKGMRPEATRATNNYYLNADFGTITLGVGYKF